MRKAPGGTDGCAGLMTSLHWRNRENGMNDRNFEEERIVKRKLAGKLGISTYELELLTWDIGEISSTDPLVLHCTLVFDGDSAQEILRKIEGLSEQNTCRISLDVTDVADL